MSVETAREVTAEARERVRAFVAAATETFMRAGYRRTKMADVTRRLGLSEGAIYRYFEGKEALFDAVVRAAAHPDEEFAVERLPVPNPAPGATLEYLKEAISERARFDNLARAMSHPAGRDGVRAELEGIVREIYGATYRYRIGLAVIDRCAMDWPELAALWVDGALAALEQRVAAYLQDRIERGWIRPVPDPRATARLMLEVVAWFAHHQHCCRGLPPFPAEVAEETVVDNIVNAYAPAPP